MLRTSGKHIMIYLSIYLVSIYLSIYLSTDHLDPKLPL